MQEVIVSVDDSRRSLAGLRVGEALASQLGASLGVCSLVRGGDSVDERRELVQQRLRERDPRGTLPAPRVEVLPAESVADELVNLLDEHDASLLCMATHSRGVVAEAALGSVASAVVQQARRPVVLAGPRLPADWQGPVRTLMLCLDGSAISEAGLPLAVELAKALKVRLRLLQVLHPDDVAGSDVSESGYLQRQVRELQTRHDVELDWEVLHGRDAGEAVAAYCNAEPGAMVVMTTHGRSGLARMALGSVAHQVVHDAECPVVVLRPRRQP